MVDFARLTEYMRMRKSTSEVILTGQIDRLFTSNPGFSAGKILVLDCNGKKTRAIESFSVKQQLSEGMRVSLSGKFETHPKYGSQFVAKSAEISIEMDAEGLALWLEKNKSLAGIGKSKGRLIADTFGENFDRVITEEPSQVQTIAKLSDESIKLLQYEWETHRSEMKLITWLAGFELSFREVEAIREQFGQDAISILTENPYLLIREIPRFAFKRVDAIARKTGIPKNHQGRVRQGIIWCVREALEQGDTYVERAELIRKAVVLLEPDSVDGKKQIEDLLDEECWHGKHICERTWGEPQRRLILDQNILRDENFIAELVWQTENMENRHFTGATDKTLGELVSRVGPKLNELQHSAVLMALRHQICVLSGGAGTGKTYTLTTLCDVYQEMGLKVKLCAPTGKAARRLEQGTGRESQTIHRLLGYNPRNHPAPWEFDTTNPLTTDLVIVDETSMVDSRIAYRLLSAISYSRTAVLFVGDHHQLPPVGPGNLLRDLMASKSVHKAVLTECHRQAGILAENAGKVLQGIVEPTSVPVIDKHGDEHVPWQVIKQLREPLQCQKFIVEGMRQILESWPDANLIEDIQILTPQKERELGTKALNIELQRVVQKIKYGVDVEPVEPKRRPPLYVHDKVIQTKNDYDLDVMNGTLGQIVAVDVFDKKSGKFHTLIKFEGKDEPVAVDEEKIKSVQLAYALTIHKSQGSEFPFVILVVHRSHSFMLNRGLFYTGATRASEKLIIAGDSYGISAAAKTEVVDKRKTWLSLQI